MRFTSLDGVPRAITMGANPIRTQERNKDQGHDFTKRVLRGFDRFDAGYGSLIVDLRR